MTGRTSQRGGSEGGPAGAGRALLEARFFPRAAVDLPAEFHFDGGLLAGTVQNLSVGGAFLGLSPGATAPVRGLAGCLRVQLSEGALELLAHVVWARSDEGVAAPGVALSFDDVTEVAALSIQRLVESVEPMAWDPGGEARALPREVALRFVPVLRRMAGRLGRSRPNTVASADDLVGAGFLGLVEAFGRWPSRTLAGFEPYALVRMRGAMIDELRRADPLGRRGRRRAREVELASAKLWSTHGRRPEAEEVATYLGMTLADYEACRRALATQTSPVDIDEVPAGERGPDELAATHERGDLVRSALAALPPRLREVLAKYYGEDCTLREIGNLLGVSESRISQLLAQAMAALRDGLPHDAG